MERDTHDYNYYMGQAKKYRDMANNDDGHRRRVLLGIAQEMTIKARHLKRDGDEPGSNSE